MKKLLALLAAAAMLISALAACGSTTPADNSGQSETTAETGKTDTKAGTSEEAATEAGGKFEKHADLKMLYIAPMPLSDDASARLSKAISAITEEKFNASVELVSVTFSDYANKMNMMLATGEQIDIFQPIDKMATFASQGYLMNLNDYSEYYKDAAALVGDYIKAGMIDGNLYTLPTTAQGTTGGDSWVFRSDIYEELDLGPMLEKCRFISDLEPVLQKIKDNTEYVPLIGTTSDNVVRSQGDGINGKTYINLNTFCYVDPEELGVVKEFAALETQREMADLAYRWAQMGLSSYDEVGSSPDLFKAGRSGAYYYGYSPVVQFEAESATGMDVKIWKADLEDPWVSGNAFWGYCLSSYCEAPEQALSVINEFYINPDLTNILEWGEEGVDYVVVDEEKGLIDFPEGINQGNVGFYNYIKDSVANQFICYENVHQEGFHAAQLDFQKNHVRISPYIGFTFNADNVANEITACTNVNEKYLSGLMNGLLNPEEYYPKYLKELEDNGIQRIVDETQKQLDAWIAENK